MSNELSFQRFHGKATLNSHYHILDYYKKNLQKAIGLDNEFPIFLDTNVLLRTYSISFKARNKLFDFFNRRKKGIYITNNIQIEFIKNREDVINRFFDNVTNKIPNDFKSEVISQIGSFLERNKIIFKDYELFEKKVLEIKTQCENLYEELLKQVAKQEQENTNLLFEDKQLNILSEVNILESISDEEIKMCQLEYDSLSKGIDPEKVSSVFLKAGKVFPGVGDLKEKPEYPYGDYIIYYELMKFAKDTKKDIIFLTYDTTKGDWMKKDKKPHLQYLENFFLNTGQMIFILDAERVFEELLDISFKSLIQIKEEEKIITPVTIETLSYLLVNRYSHIKDDAKDFDLNDLYLELIENGYTSIEQIVLNLNRAERAFEEYIRVEEKGINRFTRIGNLRIRMYISDKNYRTFKKDTRTYEIVGKEEYKPFLHLLN